MRKVEQLNKIIPHFLKTQAKNSALERHRERQVEAEINEAIGGYGRGGESLGSDARSPKKTLDKGLDLVIYSSWLRGESAFCLFRPQLSPS
jgi:hypothetical protein